jgi:hypothetical protein
VCQSITRKNDHAQGDHHAKTARCSAYLKKRKIGIQKIIGQPFEIIRVSVNVYRVPQRKQQKNQRCKKPELYLLPGKLYPGICHEKKQNIAQKELSSSYSLVIPSGGKKTTAQ